MSPGSETRDRLLAEALKIFAQKGYDGATVGEIARSAGVAEGTIYRHFESKKDLFIACLEPGVQRLSQQIMAGISEAQGVRDVARATVLDRIRQMTEDRETWDILFTGLPNHPELFELLINRVILATWNGGVVRHARHLLESGQIKRQPSFTVMGVGMTAAIWAIIHFEARMQAMKDKEGVPNWTDGWVDKLIDFVLYGIAGQPAGGDNT